MNKLLITHSLSRQLCGAAAQTRRSTTSQQHATTEKTSQNANQPTADHRNYRRQHHLHALSRQSAARRSQLHRTGDGHQGVEGSQDRQDDERRAALQRHHLPSRHSELHDPGRRSDGHRHRRSGLHLQGRVQSRPHLRPARPPGHGQQPAPNTNGSQFFITEVPTASPERPSHHLRPVPGHRRGEEDCAAGERSPHRPPLRSAEDHPYQDHRSAPPGASGSNP